MAELAFTRFVSLGIVSGSSKGTGGDAGLTACTLFGKMQDNTIAAFSIGPRRADP